MLHTWAVGVHSVVVYKLKGNPHSSVEHYRERGPIYSDHEELAAWCMYHDSALFILSSPCR